MNGAIDADINPLEKPRKGSLEGKQPDEGIDSLSLNAISEAFKIPLSYEEARARYPEGVIAEVSGIIGPFETSRGLRLVLKYAIPGSSRPLYERFSAASVPLILNFAAERRMHSLAELVGKRVKLEWQSRPGCSRAHLIPVEMVENADIGAKNDKEGRDYR